MWEAEDVLPGSTFSRNHVKFNKKKRENTEQHISWNARLVNKTGLSFEQGDLYEFSTLNSNGMEMNVLYALQIC